MKVESAHIRIFYVCYSRAKNNLIVYYPNPTSSVIDYFLLEDRGNYCSI